MVLCIDDSIRNMKRYDFYSLSPCAVKLPMRVEGGRSLGFDTVFEVEKPFTIPRGGPRVN